MTGFRGWDESGRVIDPLAPAELRPMVLAARESVTVASESAQAVAERTGGESWLVRVSSVAPEPALTAITANADATFDLLRSWAADDGWWRDAFTWTPV